MKNKFTKIEKSWICYDWANSVYATNFLAALMPIYFGAVCAANGVDNLVLWSLGTSIATFTIALLAPFLGALADNKGYKKKLFFIALLLGVIFTAFCAFTDDYRGMLVGYIISHIGYSGANLFYDSFITDVTSDDKMDKVSAWGYAMGYIGGSTIAFVISIVIMFVMGMDNPQAMKIVIVLTAVWWFVFSIPMLKNVKQKYYIEKNNKNIIIESIKNLRKTFRDIVKDKKILTFVLAYFFYIDGVSTVISVSTSYGATLKLDTVGMIMALLVTQVVAVPSSILFSRLSEKFSAFKMLKFAIIVYILICCIGTAMGLIVEIGEGSADSVATAQILFWVVAVLVGTVQGGIQALSRSFFGKIIPPERSSEYFGFFDIFGKFAAVLGPIIIAVSASVTGYDYVGIAGLAILFALGYTFLSRCEMYHKK